MVDDGECGASGVSGGVTGGGGGGGVAMLSCHDKKE